jgi:hypothetical protein
MIAPTMELEEALRILAAFEREKVEYVLAGDYPAIQYAPLTGDFSIDLLARLGERFRFDDLEWQEVILDGIHVRVATPRMLYRMKRDTVRPQDKIDASVLRERFELEDE